MKSLPLHTPQYERLHRDFVRYINSLGYSTRGGRMPYFPYHVREFLFILEQKGITEIRDVTALDVIAHHNYLKERPNHKRDGGAIADATISQHMGSLRLFYDYMLDAEIVDSCPARLPRFNLGRKKVRDIITVEEVPLIYDACQNLRDKAIISLAYGCGLRRCEVYATNTVDIAFHKGTLLVRDGKGGKSRVVPISNTVIRYLKEYLVYERPSYIPAKKTSSAFIVNNHGNRMKAEKINERVKEIIQLTGNKALIRKDITLHCLRHSIATHLLDAGASIEFVQEFLGHKDIDMSHYYARKRKQKTAIFKQFG